MSLRQLADALEEEMAERGWSAHDVAIRIVAYDLGVEELALEMLLACRDEPSVIVTKENLERYARAFGVSSEFLANIYKSADGRRGED